MASSSLKEGTAVYLRLQKDIQRFPFYYHLLLEHGLKDLPSAKRQIPTLGVSGQKGTF